MEKILEKYEVRGNTTGKHNFGGHIGEVDFDKLTLAEADNLYNAGCEAFILKPTKAVKPAEK